MDYRTKPISREKIRNIANWIRILFRCKNKYYFDIVKVFEAIPLYFDNLSTEIVCDDDIELKNIPATTIQNSDGSYCIKIKEKVYNGAYKNKNGGYRMHITHEISHFILFYLGYTPYYDRNYKNYKLNPYESVEWQAKALAGEILIPYDTTKNLSVEEIIKKCKVSKEAAINRKAIK